GVVAAAGIAHAPTAVAVGIVAEPAGPIPAPAVGKIAEVAAAGLAGPTPVVAETVVETKGALAVPSSAAGAVVVGPMSVAQVVEIEEAVDPTAVVVVVAPSHFA